MARKKKKIKGIMGNDALSSIVGRSEYKDLVTSGTIDCKAKVIFNKVFVDNEDITKKYRPFVSVLGSVSEITGAFPSDVKYVTFSKDKNVDEDYGFNTSHNPFLPNVRYNLELSNEDIAELAKNGLYDNTFVTNNEIIGTTFELPVSCSYKMIMPEVEDDVPIVFLQIENPYDISITKDQLGFDMNTLFAIDNSLDLSDFNKDSINEISFAEDTFGFDVSKDVEEELVSEDELDIEDVEKTPEDLLIEEAHEQIEERVDEKLSGKTEVEPVEAESALEDTVEAYDETEDEPMFPEDEIVIEDDEDFMGFLDEISEEPSEKENKVFDLDADTIDAESFGDLDDDEDFVF